LCVFVLATIISLIKILKYYQEQKNITKSNKLADVNKRIKKINKELKKHLKSKKIDKKGKIKDKIK
jgi:hypothetical protein